MWFPSRSLAGEGRDSHSETIFLLEIQVLLLEEKSEEVSRERGSLEDILEEQAGDGKKKGS